MSYEEVDVVWALTCNGMVSSLYWTEEAANVERDRLSAQHPSAYGLYAVRSMGVVPKRSPSGGEDK